MAKFDTDPRATKLVRRAEAVAVEVLKNKPATESVLEHLANLVRQNILAQVLIGQWSELGIHEVDQLHPLVVTARLGRRINETRVVIEYDFSKTTLGSLLIDRRNV